MTPHEWNLLIWALLGAAAVLLGMTIEHFRPHDCYEDGYDAGWDEALSQTERTRVTEVMLGEAGGDLDEVLDEYERQGRMVIRADIDMAGPTLLTDTQQLPGQQTMTDEEYEVYAASHVISQELAALAAEDVPRAGQEPAVMASNGASESTRQAEMRAEAAGPGHLESTQEWQARMDLEAAQWCARHGLRHESAWAA